MELGYFVIGGSEERGYVMYDVEFDDQSIGRVGRYQHRGMENFKNLI